MNDTIDYFRTPPEERRYHHNKITFSMQYFYNELYLLTISHDENVHGKATLIQKMWGDYEMKFPQARTFYMYMYTHPGKKLNFMGGEFAQFREWDESREQDWDMLKYPLHDSFKRYMSELSQLYCSRPSLHCGEYDPACFKWLIADDAEHSVFAYKRVCGEETTVCVLNLSDKTQLVRLSDKTISKLTELLNTDCCLYSGSTPERECTVTADKNGDIVLEVAAFSGRMFDA